MTTQEITKLLIETLNEQNIACYLYHTSKDKNSCYVKFSEEKMGSLRVSNHKSRKKYHYRWELRLDFDEDVVIRKPHKRYLYCLRNAKNLVNHLVNYYNTIKKKNNKTRHGK